jgi:diguanylate cyclase (GGDEF)-like protein/PAS domain S-box-containing protein
MRTRQILMQTIALQLLRDLKSEHALQNFLQQTMNVFGAANASIYLLEEADPSFVRLCVGIGLDAGLIGLKMKVTEGAVGEVYRTGNAFIVKNYKTWPGRIQDPRFDRVTTSISLPLRTEEKIIGVLQLSWNDIVHPLDENEVKIWEQISVLAAVAVTSAMVFDQIRREKAITDTILETFPGVFYLFDEQGCPVRWNRKMEELTGYNSADISRMNSQDFFRETAPGLYENKMALTFQDGHTEFETDIRKKDGSRIRVHIVGAPLTINGRRHIISAGIDITDRYQAEIKLAHSEEKFRNMIDCSPLGMHLYTLNEQGDLIFSIANPTVDRLLGVDIDELLGKKIEDAFPSLAETDLPDLFRAVARNQIATQTLETTYRDDRVQGDFLITVFHIAENSVAVTFMDITQRKRMEEELRQHRDQLEQMVDNRTTALSAVNQELTAMNEEMATLNGELNKINLQLLNEIELRRIKEQELILREQQYRAATRLVLRSSQDVDGSLESILKDALQLVGAPAGYIGLYNEVDKIVQFRQSIGPIDFMSLTPRPSDWGVMGQVVTSGEPKYIKDYRNYPHRVNETAFERVTSLLSIPLKHDHRLIGILSAHWLDTPGRLSSESIESFRQYAELAAAVLDRDEMQNRLTHKNELLQGLADTSAALLGELDLESVLNGILEKTIAMTGIPHGFVYLFELNGHNGGFHIGKGRYGGQQNLSIDLNGGILAEVIRTDKMVIVRDYAHWPHRLTNPPHNEMTLIMQTPLKIGDKLIGILCLAAFGEPVSLDPDKLDAVEHLASIAAIAVKHAISHDETRKLAYYDTLTGLANRANLNLWLEAEMVKARNHEACGALFFVDLDDLKTINDTLGHSLGDGVIIAAGNHIREAIGTQAFIARIGGDEFVVIWPGQGDRTMIAQMADHLVQSLSKEYTISGERVHMSASVGVALYPDDGLTPDDILKNADSAMYAAKRSGRNCWSFFENTLQAEAYEKMILTNSLRRALEREELALQFQPKVSLPDKKIAGFEALLRWNSAEHGPVSPFKFIPFAEQSGLIVPIGEWVIKEASHFARQLDDRGLKGLHIAVNISPRQLSEEHFIDMVRNTIQENSIAPDRLEFEVTESVLMETMEESIQKLIELRTLGVGIALDDFGTGYSSLTYLRRLPVDTLKVDKSFIDGILGDDVQADLVGAIIDMAHTLNLTVVAEGVESEAQAEKLHQYNCDCIQGYVFSKPVQEASALALLQ